LQSVGPDFYPKEIKEDLPDGELLLLRRKDFGMNRYEWGVWNKAKVIHSDESFIYAALRTDQLVEYRVPEFDESELNDSAMIAFLSFDDQISDQVMTGTGAMSGTKNRYLQIAQFGDAIPPGDYIISIWVYNKGYTMPQMGLFLETRYKGEQSLPRISAVNPSNSVVIRGDWSMVEMPFTIERPIELLNLVAKGGKFSKQPFYFDNLLMRPQGSNVSFRLNDEEVVWNGYLIPSN
jgi:hypothetical protein